MSWDLINIGELCDIKHGFAFKSTYFAESGEFILLSPGNFEITGGLKLKGDKEKYYKGNIPEGYILSEGDLLVVMTDLMQSAPILGGAAIVPESNRFLHNQRLGKIVDINTNMVDIRYLYYCLNNDAYRYQVRASASGATVRHTSPDRIRKCKIPLPPLPTQRRIAEILSAYDDLIENNRRRIRLLEEAARLLYREWFVHFRFPGYQQARWYADEQGRRLPVGWRYVELREVAQLNYGKSLPSVERSSSGEYPVYGSSGIVGYHNEFLIKGPGIVLGRKGNVGTVFFVNTDFYPIDTVYFVASDYSYFYINYWLENETFLNSDAAVPGLNRNYVYSKLILLPSKSVLDQFDKFCIPQNELIWKLKGSVKIIQEARDLLLPRLMNQTLLT